MKRIVGIFTAIILMPAVQVQAWVGGPFSGNTYEENGDDGIYEAVATTANGIGMYRWAVQNNLAPTGVASLTFDGNFQNSNVQFGGLVGAVSPHVWYFRGLVYYGRCFGMVNTNMGVVNVVGNASDTGNNGSSEGINGVDLSGGLASEFDSDNLAGGTTVISQRKSTANSNFQATITQKYPIRRFKGRGTVSFVGLETFSLLYVVDPDNLDIFGDADFVNSVLVNQTEIEVEGGNDFDQQGAKFKFIVYGAQVSTSVSG